MSLFGPPNIQKLIAKRDRNGLIKALAYKKDAKIRTAAAIALGDLNLPRVTQPLCLALNDGDEDVRIEAATALASIKDEQAAEALIRLSNDYSPSVRMAAIEALQPLKSPVVVPALIGRLDDKDADVREEAAKALGKMVTEQSVDKLIERLNDTVIAVIDAAVIALGKIKNPKATEPLIAIVSAPPRVQLGSGWSKTRLHAADALGKIGDSRAVNPLLDLIYTGDKDERSAGVNALNQLGEKCLPLLVTAIKEGGSEKRQTASEFLASFLKNGRKLDKTTLDKLIEMAESEDGNSRIAAIDVLLHVNDSAVAPILVKALNLPRTREQAEQAIIKIGKPAGPALKTAAKTATGDMALILRKLMIKTGYLQHKRIQASQIKVGLFNAFNVHVEDYTIHLPTSQFAYRRFGMGKSSVVLNGNYLQEWDGVFDLTFSPDGSHFGYIARKDKTFHAVIDEQPGPGQANINYHDTFGEPASNFLILTSNGHSAYPVTLNGKWGVVRDHKVDQWFDGIMTNSIVFSKDGKRLAYAAQDKEGWFMVVDGVLGKHYAMIGLSSIVFSPDGTRLAYCAMKDRATEQWCLVENEVEKVQLKTWEPPVYSPDSQRLAYGSSANAGGTWVVDGKAQGNYSGILMAGFRFSPDSKHHAFIARQGQNNCLVRDGKREGDFYDYADPPVFSPDSQHCAFAAQKYSSQYVVVDGKEFDSHQYIGESSVTFSPDSQALAYEGIDGTKRRIFLKQTQGEIFDFIFTTNNGGIYFDTNDQIHYLAQKDGVVYWVTEKLEWVEG